MQLKNKTFNKIKLEIGGGDNPKNKNGYIICDIRKLPKVDLVCHARKLPFADNTVDEIFSRHLIEHFTLKEFLEVLFEWNRVLKTRGKLYIICPNFLWHIEQILNSKHKTFYSRKKGGDNDRFWGFGSIFGWQQDQYDIHKFGYYFELLRDILESMGFTEIKNLTDKKRSLEKAEWHLEVTAIKKRKSINYKKNKFYNHFNIKH